MRTQRGAKRGAAKRAPRRPLRRRGGLRTKGKGNRVNDVAAVSETFMFSDMAIGTIYADYGCSLFSWHNVKAVISITFRFLLIQS